MNPDKKQITLSPTYRSYWHSQFQDWDFGNPLILFDSPRHSWSNCGERSKKVHLRKKIDDIEILVPGDRKSWKVVFSILQDLEGPYRADLGPVWGTWVRIHHHRRLLDTWNDNFLAIFWSFFSTWFFACLTLWIRNGCCFGVKSLSRSL